MVSRLLGVLLMFLVALPAWGASVELQLDVRRLQEGQSTTLTVVVPGRGSAPWPRIEEPQGLRVEPQGVPIERRQLVGRQVTESVIYRFRVTAQREGRYELGPAEVQRRGDLLRSGTVILEVGPRGDVGGPPLRAEAAFDVEEAWEGQVVVYRHALHARVQVHRARWGLPPLEGLIAPRDGAPARRTYTVQDVDGVIRVEETWIPLVATGTGDRGQPAITAQVEVPVGNDGRPRDPFGMFHPTRQERLQTEAAPLRVRPLPPAPAGFGGLVGDFEVQAELSTTRATVGGSVEMVVSIEGDGTLEGFRLPPTPATPGLRTYDGSPLVDGGVNDGRYRSEGRYTRVLVPTHEGRIELPPIELVFFSPSEGEYVSRQMSLPALEVSRGSGADATVAAFGDEAPVVVEEPLQIEPIRERGPERAMALGGFLPWLLLLAGLPGLAVAGLEGIGWWRSRPRRVRPPPTPRQRLARLPTQPQARLGELEAALRHALARRTGLPPARLDRLRAAEALPPALGRRVHEVVRALDLARYAGEPPGEALEAQVREVVLALEEAA